MILGAGASVAATDSSSHHPPNGKQLGDVLSEKFLGGKLKKRSLAQIAEYSIQESSLVEVQEYSRGIFEVFEPTKGHLLLPAFRWWGLATTNYDRLIEKAYAKTIKIQNVIPMIENGDRIDEHSKDPNNVLLLKLHGCITRTSNQHCPLILTIDQYVDYRVGRSRIFDQLTDWGYEHPIVFIGHSLQDPDLRQVLKELSATGLARSRYYAVVPDADEIEKRTFESLRITILSGTFDEFMQTLDTRLEKRFRGLKVATNAALPIAQRFRKHEAEVSEACRQFLTVDADYVNAIAATATLSPQDFYRGISPGFSAIEQQLDVRRQLGDTILSDFFLIPEADHASKLEIVLIKAHAGAGKSVLLRRLAWDASRDYNHICLFMRPSGVINVPCLQELLELCADRIFLFIDDAADRVRELEALTRQIGPLGKFLTVILAERINEWNMTCSTLSSHITDPYELRYLSEKETDQLLQLLDKHRALNKLQGKTSAEQKQAFEERAGRQLLVALHEATLGLPFVEIIRNEFENIYPYEAKQVYLSICVLNRLNVPVRAGVISRVHGIPFEDFKTRLFSPLEHIVQTEFDSGSRDYAYRARHPHIAQMIFDEILRKEEDRFDSYVRCLVALNIDYTHDRIAFRQMVKARNILELFPTRELAINIYKRAQERTGVNDGNLIHQMGLYEMNRPAGSLQDAEELLSKAAALRPWDITIKHSLAELRLRFAEVARTPLEREKQLDEAVKISRQYNAKSSEGAYGQVTLIKAALMRLETMLKNDSATSSYPPTVT